MFHEESPARPVDGMAPPCANRLGMAELPGRLWRPGV